MKANRCNECGSPMKANTCDCGWQKPATRTAPITAQSEPTNTFAAVNQRARKLGINGDPAKARELFFKQGGFAKLVPTEDDEEARKEREAIQAEGKG